MQRSMKMKAIPNLRSKKQTTVCIKIDSKLTIARVATTWEHQAAGTQTLGTRASDCTDSEMTAVLVRKKVMTNGAPAV